MIARQINAERVVLLGWSRAILLQLAHPLVAAGVAENSSFRAGGASAVVRLHHTIRAMLALTFGDEAWREASLNGIRAIHRRVHGTLQMTTGVFPAGTRYDAEDPNLVLWVHATLIESIPLIYDLVVRPLSDAERDAYCAEAAAVAIDLGARPQDVPQTWHAARDYLTSMYESGRIAVGEQARALARSVLNPPAARLIAPLAAVNRTITLGLLPEHIRAQYGFPWDRSAEVTLKRSIALVRHVRKLLPQGLAIWPEAR